MQVFRHGGRCYESSWHLDRNNLIITTANMQSQSVKHVEGFLNRNNAESAEHGLLTFLEENKEGTTAFKCFDNSI